jgi:hypothetical protein
VAILIYNLIGSGNESVREILPMKTGLIALSFATAVSFLFLVDIVNSGQRRNMHSILRLLWVS